MLSMSGNVMTRDAYSSRAGGWARVREWLFASLALGLGLLLATPFVAVLLVPVYVTFYFHNF